MNDELQFQDIPHDEEKGKVQTHTFTNFPHSADSDDESGDKTELLKDEKKSPSFWTFEYYQQFFDVDTNQVFSRVLGSMVPRPGRNFLTSQIRPNPDLYGPFWICTTLVFTTAIAGNFANYLQAAGKGYVWKYDFHKVTFAATAIFSYWWLIPAALFGVLWWRGSQSRYTFLELICVYGYSLAIYIPISILWTIQINWLQWVLVIIGAALSGSVLVFTFWPAVREDNKRIAFAVIGVILVFHAALAAGFVLYFFHVSSTVQSTTLTPLNHTSIPEIQKQVKIPHGNTRNLPPLPKQNSLESDNKLLPLKTNMVDKKPGQSEVSNKSPPKISQQPGTKKAEPDKPLQTSKTESSKLDKQKTDTTKTSKKRRTVLKPQG